MRDCGIPGELVRAVLHVSCRRIAYCRDGELQLSVDRDVHLRVAAADGYRAWTVSGPGKGPSVCGIDGQVGVWVGSIAEECPATGVATATAIDDSSGPTVQMSSLR